MLIEGWAGEIYESPITFKAAKVKVDTEFLTLLKVNEFVLKGQIEEVIQLKVRGLDHCSVCGGRTNHVVSFNLRLLAPNCCIRLYSECRHA